MVCHVSHFIVAVIVFYPLLKVIHFYAFQNLAKVQAQGDKIPKGLNS